MTIDIGVLHSAAAVANHYQPAHGVRCVERPCQQVPGRRQSLISVATMTPRTAGATIRLCPVNGRDGEQSPERRRQPRAASVASTLKMTLVLVIITCDTGQSHLRLHIILLHHHHRRRRRHHCHPR